MAGKFSIEAIFKARDLTSRVVAAVSGKLGKFGVSAVAGLRQIDKTNRKILEGLDSVASKAKTVGLIVGGLATAAVLNVGNTGADFEQAIANVGAVSLMTRDQIKELEDKAIELGIKTKFTATQVAQAMELMGKAGFSNQEIIQGIGGILSAAAAEGAEVEEVAGHVSNVLKGMGLGTTEATRVADVLTLASARTNSSISSLGESMANVSSTARQLGVPLEEAVASVAALQDVGLDASVAGSAVATMLTQIAKPTDDVAAKMKKWGITFKNSNGDMLSFREVLAAISAAAKKSGGNLDQVAFFADLVGMRGQKAASNLAVLFETGKFAELADELKNAKGSAEKMAGLRMQTLRGDLTLLRSTLDVVKIGIFDLNSGPLRKIVQNTNAWITANRGLIVQKVQDTIKAIVDHLPQIWSWTKRIAIGIGIFLAWSAAIRIATITITAFEYATSAASLAVKAVRGAVALATGAYQLLKTAVLSETAATLAATAKNWLNVAAVWARNAAVTVGRIGTMRLTRAMIVSTAATVADTAKNWINAAATWAKNAAVTAYNAVVKAGTLLLGLWSAATSWDTIKAGLNAAATWARNAAQVALNATTSLGTGAMGVFAIATGGATAATDAAAVSATAANASFLPLIVTLGAVAAAFGAVYLAWKQNESLKKETEGMGILDIAGDVLKKGDWKHPLDSAFKVVNDHQNQLARERARLERETAPTPPAQLVSPQERVAQSISETTTNTTNTSQAEVTIKDQTGKAAITKAPRGKAPIRLQPSGAF